MRDEEKRGDIESKGKQRLKERRGEEGVDREKKSEEVRRRKG